MYYPSFFADDLIPCGNPIWNLGFFHNKTIESFAETAVNKAEREAAEAQGNATKEAGVKTGAEIA